MAQLLKRGADANTKPIRSQLDLPDLVQVQREKPFGKVGPKMHQKKATARVRNTFFFWMSILLMEEILHHLGCIKPCK